MCLVAVLLTIFILNLILGLLVHFFDYSEPIWWHALSPYFIALLLFIMVWSVVTELYILRKGGHSLAKQLKARRLVKGESTPEEHAALKITEHLAQTFSLNVPTLYVLPDEVGVNALTAGFHSNDIVIILTWGSLQNLDELELYGLLGHEFNQILSGEAVENTKLKILYSGLTTFSQWGSKLAKQGFKRYSPGYKHKFETVFVAVGGVIWLAGSLGVLITRFIKYLTLSGRTFRNDQKTMRLLKNSTNTQTLLRIYVHHSGSQIHSAYSESIAHMCFANSLSPQSWMNIHPSIRERIYELNREVMVAILMIRQYREFIPQDAPVSHAIVDALLNLDGRIHIQIFHDACKNIGHMPASIARQFLTKLALIIQEDGEIGLLDALLLERVKYELNLMPLHLPTAFEEVKPQIVRLIDALLHVQQINSPNQLEVRERILRSLLNPDEMHIYDEISDEPLDLAEILNDIAGLLLRDRLSILAIAEMCLWSDRIITQDELDVLELLYWRFGFESDEIVEQMQKKNSVMII